MFNSKKEFAQAMMEGGVYEYDGYEYYYDSNERFFSPFRFKEDGLDSIDSSTLDVAWSNYDKVKKVTPWYENIPENGRLCWVWDYKNQKKQIRIIDKYNCNSERKFITDNNIPWFNAEPLTDEEIKEFLTDF